MNPQPTTQPDRSPQQLPRVLPLLVGLMIMFFAASEVLAQKNITGGFKGAANYSRYYPAPNFKQLEMQLTGESPAPVPGTTNQIGITYPRFAYFRTNGEPLIFIEAPECIFSETDAKARTLHSANELLMRAGDRESSIQGRGFLWQQKGRTLIISNDVRALIKWTNNAPPMEITSRWFEFDAENNRGIFHDDVHGENTNMVFTCASLAISADKTNRNSFNLIEADGGLEVTGKIPGQYGRAQRGIYRHADQRIDLAGDAAWSFNGSAGSADRMTVWMSNTNIDASGNVKLRLPRSTLGAAGGLLNLTNAPGKAEGTNLVTILADRFTRRGPQLIAEGAVQVSDGTNQLTCDRLEGRQETPQTPDQTAVAIGNVFVGREGGGIYSERADYSKTHGQVLFTGTKPPRFVQGQTTGTAGRVIAKTTTREVLAEDGVTATLTFASNSDALLNVLPDTKTNRVAQTGRTNQTVQVTAQNFSLRDRSAVFSGKVAAHQLPTDGSEPRMHCEELEFRLAADKQRAESLQARGNVVCERGIVGMTNGPAASLYSRMDSETLTANISPSTGELVDLTAGGNVHLQREDLTARGEKAIYTRADQLLKLLGKAVIDSPDAIYTSSQSIVWSIATEQVIGSYDSIRFKPAALKRAEDSEKLSPP